MSEDLGASAGAFNPVRLPLPGSERLVALNLIPNQPKLTVQRDADVSPGSLQHNSIGSTRRVTPELSPGQLPAVRAGCVSNVAEVRGGSTASG